MAAGLGLAIGFVVTGHCVPPVVTVTVKVQPAEFPAPSVVVQVTVVVPAGKVEPLGGLHDGVTAPEQSSLAVAV